MACRRRSWRAGVMAAMILPSGIQDEGAGVCAWTNRREIGQPIALRSAWPGYERLTARPDRRFLRNRRAYRKAGGGEAQQERFPIFIQPFCLFPGTKTTLYSLKTR